MKFISRLLLWQKFAVLGALAFALVGVPTYLYFTEAQKAIDFARDEQRGIEPMRAIIELYKVIQDHRGLAVQDLSGIATVAEPRQKKQAEVDRAIESLDAMAKRDKWDGAVGKPWTRVKADWSQISAGIVSRSMTPMQARQAHHAVIREVLRIRESAADFYKLSLDPEGFTFYMMKAVVYDMSRVTDPLGLVRGTGADMLLRAGQAQSRDEKARTMTDTERLQIVAMLDRSREGLELVTESIEKAMDFDAAIRPKLESRLAAIRASVTAALKLADDQLVNASNLTYDFRAFRKVYSDATDELNKYNSLLLDTLDEALLARISDGQRSQKVVSSIILALAVIGALLGVFIVRSVLRPIGQLIGVMDKIAKGDVEARSGIDSPDEIGQLASQFDKMVHEREQAAAKFQAENEQLNSSVLALLQGVAQLARKDLTTKVTVAEDVTGPVGDALNLLASETAKVLRQVSDISADVTQASIKVKEQSDSVSSVAKIEREQVEKTASDLDIAANTMKRIADLAQASNIAADNAIKTTQNALTTVSATVGGINSIRDTIRETEKRIKRLGERSQEISGVVSLINTIAERTHILALNASMHAASAGEAGRGFAVVADEVQRLAENARQATAQISTLVSNIQVETADTVTTMNNTISQVVEGTKLAEQAGEQMRLTQQSTSELVASVQMIADSSKEQALMSAELRTRAGEIRKSSQETSDQLKEQSTQTDNLVGYARSLLTAIRVFKLAS
ncbi:MAG: methyl-accepting chemotaxis protein [Burkholderiales bacterium]